jgi:hypothetical protein
VRGYLLDGRVDISARYSARERRAVCVGVELDVGDLDVETNAGGGSQTFTSSLARDDDEEGAELRLFPRIPPPWRRGSSPYRRRYRAASGACAFGEARVPIQSVTVRSIVPWSASQRI